MKSPAAEVIRDGAVRFELPKPFTLHSSGQSQRFDPMSIDPSNYIVGDPCQSAIGKRSERFDPEAIAALRLRLPAYLEGCGVALKKSGTRLVGKCPVHDDHKPSFHVFGTNFEACGCFPCGFTGDIFETSKWLGRSSTFLDAVADVSESLGIQSHRASDSPATGRSRKGRSHVGQPAPPFALSDADREKIRAARLAFSDAFHSGDPIIDRIAESLRFSREALRLAAWGSSGLGLAKGWLCYAYTHGLKWRNPDSNADPRFVWIVGKAIAPWRMESVRCESHTIYLTEGESDCIALIAAGLEAYGASCVASPSTSFQKSWATLFRGKRVVLCFDRDQAGQAATARVAAILKGHATEILSWKGSV